MVVEQVYRVQEEQVEQVILLQSVQHKDLLVEQELVVQVILKVQVEVVELLLLARDSVLHIDHQLKRKGHAYKRVFFLQPDVVFDERGQASLVEVRRCSPPAPPAPHRTRATVCRQRLY